MRGGGLVETSLPTSPFPPFARRAGKGLTGILVLSFSHMNGDLVVLTPNMGT